MTERIKTNIDQAGDTTVGGEFFEAATASSIILPKIGVVYLDSRIPTQQSERDLTKLDLLEIYSDSCTAEKYWKEKYPELAERQWHSFVEDMREGQQVDTDAVVDHHTLNVVREAGHTQKLSKDQLLRLLLRDFDPKEEKIIISHQYHLGIDTLGKVFKRARDLIATLKSSSLH
ncbi:hypothetical protein KKG52_00575 [Patescibacteria group bacterium]|nr:hypothetical protein [Patescibacteria group bacterium]